MIRILGAITGSAVAIATLLVVIGIPQFKTEHTASERAIVTLPLPTTPVEPDDPDAGDVPDAAGGEDTASVVAGNTAELAVPAGPPQHDTETAATEPGFADAGAAVGADDSPGVALQPALDTPQSWYAFWSPFRSELAANGFVARLQSVTGLDYRVVRIRPGVYEVAFAYETDGDIAAKLMQITAATGLELPE